MLVLYLLILSNQARLRIIWLALWPLTLLNFFPSLNHCLLPLILRKAGFDPKINCPFLNYLVGRKTWYFWNNFSSPFFNVNIGVRQGLALSPILSVLYLAPVLYILKKHLKTLKIPVSILSFVDNGLLVA